MGAEQLGQGTTLGALTLSCWALRMSRLLLLLRRLGTATGLLLLLVSKPTGDLGQRQKSWVDGGF